MFNEDSLNSGGNFTLHPEGVYAAVCVAVIDLGTQTVESQKYGTKHQRKVVIQFQTSEIIQDEGDYKGKPYLTQSRFTLTINDRGLLRPFIESWRGKKYANDDDALVGLMNMNKMLGHPAQLSILHSPDGKYANIDSIMPLLNKDDAPKPTKDLVFFSLDQPNWDTFKTLSERVQKTISESPEYKVRLEHGAPDIDFGDQPPPDQNNYGPGEDFEDDIPF